MLPSDYQKSAHRYPTLYWFGEADSKERSERDPFALLAKIPAGEVPYLFIACGGKDFLIEENRQFVEFLAKKKVPYEYHEISPRYHSWDFWNDQLPRFLHCLRGMNGFSEI